MCLTLAAEQSLEDAEPSGWVSEASTALQTSSVAPECPPSLYDHAHVMR